MSQVSTSFQDSTYSSSNLPSVTTLQADIAALETAHNDTDSNAVKKDGTVAFAGNQSMGGYKLTNVGTPTASTDAVTLAVLQALYPVGTIYINATVDTNPGTLFGFGTWELFGAGRVIVGKNASDADFDTLGETGGAKTVSIEHTHTGPSHTHTGPSHTHTGSISGSARRGTGDPTALDSPSNFTTSASGTGETSAAGTGNTSGMSANATPSIVQPFIVCNAWKRVS